MNGRRRRHDVLYQAAARLGRLRTDSGVDFATRWGSSGAGAGDKGRAEQVYCVTMAADSRAISYGERNVEEGNSEPAVDEGRGAHAQDAHGCEDKDGDCAKAEAERRCDVSSGVKAGRDAGGG